MDEESSLGADGDAAFDVVTACDGVAEVGLDLPDLHFGRVGGGGPAATVGRKVEGVRDTGSGNRSVDLGGPGECAENDIGFGVVWIDGPWRVPGSQIIEGNSFRIGLLVGEMGVRDILDERPLAWSEGIE